MLVGGGSGGHIYPNLAVVERLRERGVDLAPHLVVSRRPLDAQIAEESGLGFTAVPAAPLSVRPAGAARFWMQYRAGQKAVARLIDQTSAQAVIATGGFVSGPAVAAAKKRGVPVALVSLDAVPGRANRFAAKKATRVFSAFPVHAEAKPLPRAEVVGYPLRRAAAAQTSPADARRHFGLKPDALTFLVFAGSQGAQTINRAVIEWVRAEAFEAAKDWQILHVTGRNELEEVSAGYMALCTDGQRTLTLDTDVDPHGYAESSDKDEAQPMERGLLIKPIPFCDRMDLAWRAADAALTRADAGTVAEAWANAVPCVMLPYPYHKDQHQKHNAAPLVERGGAVVVDDLIDPAQNAVQLAAIFASVLRDEATRTRMSGALRNRPPDDGAEHLARWVADRI